MSIVHYERRTNSNLGCVSSRQDDSKVITTSSVYYVMVVWDSRVKQVFRGISVILKVKSPPRHDVAVLFKSPSMELAVKAPRCQSDGENDVTNLKRGPH
jgi:hypothetical protein